MNIIRLLQRFLRAAEHGNEEKVDVFLEEGFPVNYQDLRTGQTALHITAARQARFAIRSLLKHEKTDYLLRDAQGRLPSDMAYRFGEDPALSRLLAIKQCKQTKRDGVWLTRWPDTHDRLIASAEAQYG